MTSAVLRAAEALREREQKRRVTWEAASATLGPHALAALIGGPTWTPAALAAIDPALLGGEAAKLVRREGRGAQQVIDVDPRAIPMLTARLRRVIDWPSSRPTPGLTPNDITVEIAERLANVEPLPKILTRWRELAVGLRDGAYAVAEGLLAEVRAACELGAPGRVLDLVEAAAALERLVGGPLGAAVAIARHQIEHGYRVGDDLAQLESYVAREEPQRVFDRLIDGPKVGDGTIGEGVVGGPWALHFLGVGGAGKTTFLRHLAVSRRDLAVARVDFDYLGPSYPARDPGRLLEEIIRDLRVRAADATQDSWLRSIDDRLAAIRAHAAADPSGGDPLRWFEGRELDELMSLVGSYLTSLGRPLFIFDTCEELMKLAPAGRTIPSVEVTFRTIEELHARCPALRVIFAGRRLLAEGGAGWTARPSPVRRALTARREYLALHELRGFTADEARAALAKRLPEARRDDRALIEAILARSPEDERAAPVERPQTSADRATAAEPPRYSPFRVVAYASWVAAEPEVPAREIDRGVVDPYIEHRIVRRMGPLEGLLPAIAILRELDTATLAAILRPEQDATATVEALADHEWIDVEADEARGPVLTAKSSVVEALARYLQVARAPEWTEACERIAATLGPKLEADGGVRMPSAIVAGTLRAMSTDAAVATWHGLEAHIGRDWKAALALTDALLDDATIAADPATLLGAAVRATHASALIHEQHPGDLRAIWKQVEDTAQAVLVDDDHDDAQEAAWILGDEKSAPIAWLLLQRARLGAAAAAAWTNVDDVHDQEEAVADVLDEVLRWKRLDALRTPAIAAVEAVCERAERDEARLDAKLVVRIEALTTIDGGLGAFATMLEARLHALAGAPAPQQAARRRALARVTRAGGDVLPSTLLDWLPPDSLRARIQLEAIRLAFSERLDPDDEATSALLAEPGDHAVDDDSQHLRNAIASFRRARGVEGYDIPAPASARYAAWSRFPVGPVGPARRLEDMSLRELAGPPDETPDAAWSLLDAAPVETRADLDRHMKEAAAQLGLLTRRAQAAPLTIRLHAASTLEEIAALSSFTDEPLVVDIPALPDHAVLDRLHPDQIDGVVRAVLCAIASGRVVYPAVANAPAPAASWLGGIAAAIPRRVAERASEEAWRLSSRLPERAIKLFALAADLSRKCSDAVGEAAALLAGDVARHRAGLPPAVDEHAVLAKLAEADRAFVARLAACLTARRTQTGASIDPFLARIERGARRKPARTKRLRAWWTKRGPNIVVGSIIVAIVALFIAGIWAMDTYALPWANRVVSSAFGLSGGAELLSVATAGALIYLLFNLEPLAWLRNRRRRRAIRALVTRAGIARGDDGGATITVTRDDETLMLAAKVPRAGRHPEAAGPTDQQGVPRALGPLITRIGELYPQPGPVPMSLTVAGDLAQHAWEAVLLGAHPTLMSTYAPARLIAVSRAPARKPIEPSLRASAAIRGQLGDPLDDAGVVQIIGRPVRTATAVGLDLGEQRDAPPLTVAELAPAEARLVILQGTPEAASERPTDAFRSEVSLQRELALALVAHGVAEVLVIPPLPLTTMASVQEVLREHHTLDAAVGYLADERARAHAVRQHLRGIDDAFHRAAALEVTTFIAVIESTGYPVPRSAYPRPGSVMRIEAGF